MNKVDIVEATHVFECLCRWDNAEGRLQSSFYLPLHLLLTCAASVNTSVTPALVLAVHLVAELFRDAPILFQ